jgi:hypothetical protein
MSGKVTLSPLNLNQQVDITLGDIATVLNKRQAALKLKPQDSNAATHLIRLVKQNRPKNKNKRFRLK